MLASPRGCSDHVSRHFQLTTEHALDVRLSVMCGQVFRWRDLPDGGVLGVDGDHWWRVRQQGANLEIQGNGSPEEFKSLFRMDEDWTSYEKHIRAAVPELAPYMDELQGLRLLKPSDVVEETFSFLCTSNNHLPRIKSMVESLSCQGEVMDTVDGEQLWRFPSVEVIAELPESRLGELGFGYRRKFIPKAARQIVERGGRAWLESLKGLTYEEARLELLPLAGIGPKLADCICLFALGHTEAVPVDTHVWQAFVRLWRPDLAGKALTDKRYHDLVCDFKARLGPLAGWAHQFLFYENLLNWRSRRV